MIEEWVIILIMRERSDEKNAANINLNLFSRDGTSRKSLIDALFIPHGLYRSGVCISPPLAHVTDLLWTSSLAASLLASLERPRLQIELSNCFIQARSYSLGVGETSQVSV